MPHDVREQYFFFAFCMFKHFSKVQFKASTKLHEKLELGPGFDSL